MPRGRYAYHACHYLSVLIHFYVMHQNNSVQLISSVSNLIFHCNNAMQIKHSSQFVKARQPHQVVVYLMQNLPLRGRPPPIIFARIVRPTNALYFVADSVHTKKLCSRLSSKWFSTENGRFAFLSPLNNNNNNNTRSSIACLTYMSRHALQINLS